MGEVYQGTQLDLGRRVAIKLIRDTRADQTSFARFEREARSAAALGSPHICQITDFLSVPGQPPFLVMEFLEGRSLAELIRQEAPLDAERALKIGVQMLAGLAAAHRAGIVHRDVKPANVMVVGSAVGELVKLVDFGIAKLIHSDASQALTATGMVVGTIAYMAPEQATGAPVDGRADLYATAACLYAALTGRRPFEGRGEQLVALLSEDPAPISALRSDLHPALAAAVMRALAKRPEQRFQTAEEMSEALSACLPAAPSPAGTGVHSMPASTAFGTAPLSGTWQATAQPPPRSPATGGRGLGVLLVLGVGLLLVGLVVALGLGAFFLLGESAPLGALDPSNPLASDAGAKAPVAPGAEPADTSAPATGRTSKSGTARGSGGSSPADPSPTATATGTATATATATSTATAGPTSTTPEPAPNPTAAPTAVKGATLLQPCSSANDCTKGENCTAGKCVCGHYLLKPCNGKCVDFRDPKHCGGCNIACANDEECYVGKCVKCTPPKTLCAPHLCVLLDTNHFHCGACNNYCTSGQCTGGQCK